MKCRPGHLCSLAIFNKQYASYLLKIQPKEMVELGHVEVTSTSQSQHSRVGLAAKQVGKYHGSIEGAHAAPHQPQSFIQTNT